MLEVLDWIEFQHFYLLSQALTEIKYEIIHMSVPDSLIDLEVSNFEYLFWFLPLCLPAENYNIYSIFKIQHVQIEELPRTFNINLGKKCTPYFTFHIFRYTHVYNFIHNFCQSVAQAIKKDWYDIPYFLKYCPTTLLWYLY